MTTKHHWLTILCDILGWIYFLAWSVSFYPQTIINYRRKCVIGLSFDYMGIYNFTGFLFYSIYTIATFIHHDGASNANNPIAINDIAFAVHAFILTTICCIQILIYDRGDQKPSMFAVLLGFVLWIISIYNVVLSAAFDDLSWFGAMSTISWLGYCKVIVTTVKYVPQVWMNCKDKSTTGWSIHNVLLDFTGGSLSLLQQILSAYNTNDWGFVTHNIPKFILGFESVFFDIIFMIQHYVLYGDNDSPLRASKAQLLEKENRMNADGNINADIISQRIGSDTDYSKMGSSAQSLQPAPANSERVNNEKNIAPGENDDNDDERTVIIHDIANDQNQT